MRILTVTSISFPKYSALLRCEHCGHEQMLRDGLSDRFYHQNVLPKIHCLGCMKNSESTNTAERQEKVG